MYVCGITPYDATHLGHAATYIAFDLVHRYWRDLGHTVHYVQNVTDVDDPLLERAIATGQDWRELARAETALFAEDMTALRVLPPRHYIGAVESIPSVVHWVDRLRAAGFVYDVDGDLYFNTVAAPGFGTVAGLGEAAMQAIFAERGGDPARPGKRTPLDCMLWQAARPDEPAWDTDLGHGRPGWHIECTAIALDHLGMGFDVQGGGSDLAFPHHEMCSAQARAATGGAAMAEHFVHAGMVGYDGHKMSKSRGNLVFVSHLRRSGTDPAAIRLALLAHHYRSDWQWRAQDLAAAERRLAHWRAACALPTGPSAEGLLAAVRERLAEDLEAPAALTLVDAWAAAALARETGPTGPQNGSRIGVGSAAPGDSSAPGQVRHLLDTLLGVDLS